MTAKHRTLLIAIVAAAAIAAYWFLLLTPKQEEAAKLADQITTKQAELDKAKQEVATYLDAKASYKANYVAVTRLGKAMPTDDDTRSLMVQVQSAAERSGVEFLTIDVGKGAVAAAPAGAVAGTFPPGVSPNAAGFGELPFSFTFSGSYFEMSEFLDRLERFVTVSNKRIDVTGRLLTLQSIDLMPDQASGGANVTAAISATSYLLPKEDAAVAGAAPAAATPAGTSTAAATAAPATSTTTATAGAAG